MPSLEQSQIATCRRFGVNPIPAPPDLKVGIALNVKENLVPLYAIRYDLVGDTSGWYIWRGEEVPDDPDFFVPLCISHLDSWCPDVLPYLQLPPGWRVILAPGYEDVWEDTKLLD
ncbi:hypothetical protein [Paludisphaera sp.]|uniref:immunity protein Imm33 domain-containing protein n=1 Tax=Paludisphaera sp. TaxID=2017432 RepID=UPI00301CD97C